MFEITKEIEFDMGHRVPNHKSKCKNPHGHRYKVRATLVGGLQEEGSSEGMVEDFGDLKDVLMREIHDVLDHGFMMYEGDSHLLSFYSDCLVFDWKVIKVPFVPTAENLAKWCFEKVTFAMPNHIVKQVVVWETPTSRAYYPSDFKGE